MIAFVQRHVPIRRFDVAGVDRALQQVGDFDDLKRFARDTIFHLKGGGRTTWDCEFWLFSCSAWVAPRLRTPLKDRSKAS